MSCRILHSDAEITRANKFRHEVQINVLLYFKRIMVGYIDDFIPISDVVTCRGETYDNNITSFDPEVYTM